jgi:crotonobetainyl-CoA:carnitine CoA-transferase CaiB-like acyl-CoA transferase
MGAEQQTLDRATGPLSGVRVLDLTTIILGPYATQMLGDLGADIIKIESPGAGDLMRHMGPGRNPGMSGIFLNVNRNKRSIVLDLKLEEGKQVLRRLIASADVFFHNMRPQAIARLGFDYASVAALKADIIYCGAYGYSTKGPYAARPAYDDLIQGITGLAALGADGEGAPRYTPTVISDKLVGLMSNQAILAALFHRANSGQGQQIEVPMFESVAAFLLTEHMCGRAFEPPLSNAGNQRVLSAHRKPVKAKDGYLCILPYTDANWAAFFEISGRQELASDPRFEKYTERMQNIDALYELMGEAAAQKTVAQWSQLCEARQIPWAPVNTLDDLFDDEHLRAINFFAHSAHPSEGDTVLAQLPLNFSATPTSIHRYAPQLGEHGDEVLRELGLSDDELHELRQTGALGTSAPSP